MKDASVSGFADETEPEAEKIHCRCENKTYVKQNCSPSPLAGPWIKNASNGTDLRRQKSNAVSVPLCEV